MPLRHDELKTIEIVLTNDRRQAELLHGTFRAAVGERVDGYR
jgi:hypothetical protein